MRDTHEVQSASRRMMFALAAISHRFAAAGADLAAFAALRRALHGAPPAGALRASESAPGGFVNAAKVPRVPLASQARSVLSSTPARLDSRSPCKCSHLHALASRIGEKWRLAFTVATALALSGCGALTGFLGDEEDEAAPAKLESFEAAAGVKTLWSRRIASGEGGRQLDLRAVLAEGRLFAAGHDGDVGAFDPFTGERLWEADTGLSLSAGPGAGRGLVVAGDSAGNVVALSSADGTIAWRARLTSEVLSPPAVGERVVAVRTVDGKLHGLDAASGARIWVYDRTVPALSLRGTSAPVIAGEVVVAGFDSGHLAAVSLGDGQLLWEFQVAAPTGQTELERLADIDADPVVADGAVYAVAFQGRVAAFELRTGRPLWQRDMSSHAGLGVGRRLVYVTDEESHVWAFDRGTGASLWRQDGLARRGVTRPVELGDYVVVADSEGYVHWLSIDDGRFAARTRARGGAVPAPPVTGDTAVYVLGGSGTLTSLAHP